jgi:hypothetical protein
LTSASLSYRVSWQDQELDPGGENQINLARYTRDKRSSLLETFTNYDLKISHIIHDFSWPQWCNIGFWQVGLKSISLYQLFTHEFMLSEWTIIRKVCYRGFHSQETYASFCGRLKLTGPRDAFLASICKASLPPHYTLNVLKATPSTQKVSGPRTSSDMTVGGIPAAGDNDIRHQVVAVGKNQHSKVIKFDLFIPAKLPKCFAVVIRNFKLIFLFVS